MNYSSNENISLHYDLRTKEASVCSNRREDLDDYIDLYHDDDSLFNEEKYTFYVSTV